MRTRRIAPLVAAGILVACSESPTAPTGAGTYVLRAVAGATLPTPILSSGFGGRYVADTLRFEPRVLALFAGPTVERNTLVENPGGGLHPQVEYISYERQGAIFQFSYACPPYADCAIGFIRGTLDGDHLEISLQGSFRSPLLYERVRPD